MKYALVVLLIIFSQYTPAKQLSEVVDILSKKDLTPSYNEYGAYFKKDDAWCKANIKKFLSREYQPVQPSKTYQTALFANKHFNDKQCNNLDVSWVTVTSGYRKFGLLAYGPFIISEKLNGVFTIEVSKYKDYYSPESKPIFDGPDIRLFDEQSCKAIGSFQGTQPGSRKKLNYGLASNNKDFIGWTYYNYPDHNIVKLYRLDPTENLKIATCSYK